MDARTNLLARLFDYAGLFPPTRLPMADAVRTFVSDLEGPHGWLLDAFVAPVERLGELGAALDGEAAGRPLRLALLAPRIEREVELSDTLGRSLQAAASFLEPRGGTELLARVEMKLPANVTDAGDRRLLSSIAASAADTMRTSGFGDRRLFIEVPLTAPSFRGAEGIGALAEGAAGAPIAVKIRLGGTADGDVPEATQVARAIVACRRAHLAMKATQGLHGAVRDLDPDTGAQVHGFLNVTAAAILAEEHDLAPQEVQAILEEEDPQSFRFVDSSFAWEDLSLGTAAIARGRRDALVSIGSCSFDEPLGRLFELGILEEGGSTS